MIKRRFYKQEHGDKDDVPSDSSSSSDSDLDGEASVDSDEENDNNDNSNKAVESKRKEQPSSSSSGYESEDSSGNEVNLDSSDSLANDDDDDDDDDDDSGDENNKQAIGGSRLPAGSRFDMVKEQNTKAVNDAKPKDAKDCILKSKSVFKCKLCPRIVCLTEETLKTHLKSKRHARSEKLLKEGRLKMMLNSDGEIEELEEDGQTHQERHAATLALAESVTKDSRKSKGRQRQRKRLKKKTPDDVTLANTEKSVKRPAKKTSDDVTPTKTEKSVKRSAKKTSDDVMPTKTEKSAKRSAKKSRKSDT